MIDRDNKSNTLDFNLEKTLLFYFRYMSPENMNSLIVAENVLTSAIDLMLLTETQSHTNFETYFYSSITSKMCLDVLFRGILSTPEQSRNKILIEYFQKYR